MARLDFEDFVEEVTRVYIAGELDEAKRVESVLTRRGIDYAVEIEPYRKLVLGFFPCVYAGAGFFVLSAQVAPARMALLAAGLKAGIQDDGPVEEQTDI